MTQFLSLGSSPTTMCVAISSAKPNLHVYFPDVTTDRDSFRKLREALIAAFQQEPSFQ